MRARFHLREVTAAMGDGSGDREAAETEVMAVIGPVGEAAMPVAGWEKGRIHFPAEIVMVEFAGDGGVQMIASLEMVMS